jgi:hypothetical protein
MMNVSSGGPVGHARTLIAAVTMLLVVMTRMTPSVALQLGNVQRCLEAEIAKTNWKKKTDAQFHLHYGDGVVEIFNVLSKYDIKRLVGCFSQPALLVLTHLLMIAKMIKIADGSFVMVL